MPPDGSIDFAFFYRNKPPVSRELTRSEARQTHTPDALTVATWGGLCSVGVSTESAIRLRDSKSNSELLGVTWAITLSSGFHPCL